MNYEQAIEFIRAVSNNGTKQGLERNGRLTELMGNPQENYKIVHVTGTNGKGSTCNMLNNVLISSGYKTGLFISPHLEEFNERIQINNTPIDKDSLTRIASEVKEKVGIMYDEGYKELTEFEIITAIGFKYFEEQKIDILVLEVGMGGRHDASNVIKNSLVSVITSISLDHTEFLGDTIEKIAYEKAGIIKEKSNVVIYPQDETINNVIKEEAQLKNSSVFEADIKNIRLINSDLNGQTIEYLKNDIFNLPELKINFLGPHQLYNTVTALLTLEILKNIGLNITEKSIINGFKNCSYIGRFEIICRNPFIILDGAHNQNGIEYFSKSIQENFKDKKIILFYGMLKDKNPESVLDFLIPICEKIYTLTPNSHRAMSAIELAELINNRFDIPVKPLNNCQEAFEIVQSLQQNDIVAFVGSLYLIGEIRSLLKQNKNVLAF
ncbi:MAG: FolC bifunctional protein [Bacillota bacterium]|jgi:dihydrofolate synthase/folylpolyglutamate synthase|nr:FolC bifunctional protein [Bacillota bacterium]